MKRDISNTLLIWKEKKQRKPIILRGARQVGKTTVVRELGESFQTFIEINFEEKPDLITFFEGNLTPDEIVDNLQNYLGAKIQDGNTLLFLDEVQMCPRAILSLRYFFEKRPNLHVIAAGSLIDFALKEISFPVGRVDFLYLYPMSFGEYLNALGKEALRMDIRENRELPEGLHRQVLAALRDYTIVGGMPQVIAEYLNSKDLTECQNIQSSIINTFLADFPKYAKHHQLKYLTTVFTAVPVQLGRKFKYANISNLYKSRDLGEALELLELAGLLTRIHHTSANGIPLEQEKDFRKFKVIFFDIGLAMRVLRIPFQELLLNDDITLINEGAMAEQLVGQELLAYASCRERGQLYYWHREAKSSNAEVDYILEQGRDIIPVEVKSGLKGRTRSLQAFISEKQSARAVCLSRERPSESNGVFYRPLYAVESLTKVQE